LSWDQEFHQPIIVPGKRKPLVTLLDAARYMTSLPKAERGADHWWPAVTLIKLIGEKHGCMFFMERAIAFGLRKGINDPPVFDPDRKLPPWRKRRLARDR
jgi:hypothetical protein